MCGFLAVVCREVQYIVLQNIATMSIQRKVSAHGVQKDQGVQGSCNLCTNKSCLQTGDL